MPLVDDGRLLEEDGKTPASYDYNARITAAVAKVAHAVGMSVGGGKSAVSARSTGASDQEVDGHGFEGTLDKSKLVTDPDEAAAFLRHTDVDALAVAIGTSHGAYKISRAPTGDILAMDVLRRIHERAPSQLVMHGASTVPEELQDLIGDLAK